MDKKNIKIVGNCLVVNEERWVWYALKSVIDYIDEILVWDTGSTDRTVEIVKAINNPKIKFREYGLVTPQAFTQAHQEMLEETNGDWLLWFDGDEIWPEGAISQTVQSINQNNNQYDFLVSRCYNLIGDVFHYQEETAGKYHIGPFSGHLNIRAVNLQNVPGLHFDKPHGQIGIYDQDGILIQDRKPLKTALIPQPYLHTTHLLRSNNRIQDKSVPKRSAKFKYELGETFPTNFSYPKVFYYPHPLVVPTVWRPRTTTYILNAAWQSPLRWLKRRLVFRDKIGY